MLSGMQQAELSGYNSTLESGGSLTPEQQASYDYLMSIANEGYDLTNTTDFLNLYNAFYAIADDATKAEFERLYGVGLVSNPDGTIYFTQPGILVEDFQRRGLSINDGPVMALMAQGLEDYMAQVSMNANQATLSSYAAMTPIREQNIRAASSAGQIASAGPPGGAGEAGGGEIRVPEPPRPPTPSVGERIAPALITALGGVGAAFAKPLADKIMGEKKPPAPTRGQDEWIVNPNERAPGEDWNYRFGETPQEYSQNPFSDPWQTTINPYPFGQPAQETSYGANPYGDPYGDPWSTNPSPPQTWLGSSGDQPWDNPYGSQTQSPDPYQSTWNQNDPYMPGGSYDPYSWSNYTPDYSDPYAYSDPTTYYPSDDWGTGWY